MNQEHESEVEHKTFEVILDAVAYSIAIFEENGSRDDTETKEDEQDVSALG